MVEISALTYDGTNFTFQEIEGVEGLHALPKDVQTTWINIEGLENKNLLKAVADLYELHPLILDDLKEVSSQPKSVFYDEMIFVVLRMLSTSGVDEEITSEHISIVLGKNIVITFQEGKEGDVFDEIRERLPKVKSKHAKNSAAYICYHLLHAIIDNYSDIIEKTGERIEELEELILENPTKSAIVQLHELRNDLLQVRKAIVPLRDILFKLSNDDDEIISKEVQVYYKDLYNHAVHQVEQIEASRELAMGLQDLYLSSASTRTNEVMKVLTVITAIFIPLTFIAGVYGMNFKYMPELESPYGYPLVLLFMLLIALGMAIFYKIKKWF
ncbi:MAG: magnesium/cobalt transporter CorA [Ignavibacteriales bacterium]|nr:magnesium/cobalt transporter CorA [Ignavibacteriales bacterium]